MQDKSFKAWINMHLSRDKIKVEVLPGVVGGAGVLRRGHARGAQANLPLSPTPAPTFILILLRT